MAKKTWWRRLLGVDERQENRTAGSGFEVIIDGNPMVFPISVYKGGMSIPGAWRAANLISDLLGSVPWCAYRSYGGNPTEKIEPTPPLLEQPDPENNRMDTFSSWALDLIWNGNACGIIADRNSDGYPTAVYPVPADQVGVRRVFATSYSPLPIGSIEYNIGPLTLSPYDVIHIKGPHAPGALRGFGVLEAFLNGTLSLHLEQQKQAQSLAEHGVPTGLLKVTNPDATEDDLKAAKAGWLASQASRTIAALNATTDFQPLAWNPEQMQMVEARKYSLVELALIFGVPAYFLNADQASRTYSNVEQEGLNLLKYTLAGHLARFEQTLSAAFPRGTKVEADLDSVLRSDTLTRYQAYQIGVQTGFLELNDVRAREYMAPLPETATPPVPSADGQVVPLRASQLQVGQGHALWAYWTHGKGLARWAESPTPYRSLVAALLSEDVPAHEVHGLARNIFVAVFQQEPAEHAHHG